MTRARALRLALLLALLLAPAALADEVVVYSPHGGAIRDEFVGAFREAHPETEVRWLDMGAGEVLERVRAESERPAAHVWWGGPATPTAPIARPSGSAISTPPGTATKWPPEAAASAP